MNKTLYLIVILSLYTIKTQAQTNTILDGFWNTAANWDNGIPGKNDVADITKNMILNTDLSIESGAIYIVTGSILEDNGGGKKGITMKNDGYLEIDGNVSINGNLKLEGDAVLIIRGCDTLTIGDNFELKGNASFTLEDCAVLIVGDDMKMEDNATGEVEGTLYVNDDVELKNDADISGNGNFQSGGETDIKNNGSLFGSASGCNPGPCEYGNGTGLPITLLNFDVKNITNNKLEVDWTTSSEINNDYFTIYYGNNPHRYEDSITINGAGNSYNLKNYSVTLSPKSKGWNYIQLKQTDYDGKFEIFKPISIYIEKQKSAKLDFLVSPNPIKNQQIDLKIFHLNNENFELILHNGKNIIQQETLHNECMLCEKTLLKWPIQSDLLPGIYFITIKTYHSKVTKKIIIL